MVAALIGGARRVLIVSPTPTHPQNAGSRARVHALARALVDAGHEVHFFFIRRESGDEAAMRDWWGTRFHAADYAEPPQRRPLPALLETWLERAFPAARFNLPIDAWFDDSVLPALAELQARERFDVVMVEYVFFSKALSAFGDEVLKIIDTHDVFTDRFRLFLDRGSRPDWFSTSREQEGRGLRRAQRVLAIQDREREHLAAVSGVPTVTVGHLLDVRDLYRPDESRRGLLFVGSGNPVNVDSMRHFVSQLLPRIRERAPDAELSMAGRICHWFRPEPGLRLLGELDDLAPAYQGAAVVIAPMRFGTGLNIKVIESLGHGMPLVATANAVKGIDASEPSFVVAEDDAQFVAAVCDLRADPVRRRQLSDRALALAAKWNRQQQAALLHAVAPAAEFLA